MRKLQPHILELREQLSAVDDRRLLANRMESLMQDRVTTKCPGMRVHWDDCDLDCRVYWFMFSYPELAKVRQVRSPAMRQASWAIRLALMDAKDVLSASSVYEAYWRIYSRPESVYSNIGGWKKFERYARDYWFYTLSFYG